MCPTRPPLCDPLSFLEVVSSCHEGSRIAQANGKSELDGWITQRRGYVRNQANPTVITNIEDPKFDLEKLINYYTTSS